MPGDYIPKLQAKVHVPEEEADGPFQGLAKGLGTYTPTVTSALPPVSSR